MKIAYEDRWSGRGAKEMDVQGAILHKLTPSPYSYEGAFEKTETAVQLQAEMLARLVDTLVELLHDDSPVLLKRLLGDGYEVAE